MEIPSLDDGNGWSDFWRHNIGVNVIPAVGWIKKPLVKWTQWQNKPVPPELHEEWKSKKMFDQGLAIIMGQVWHRKDRKGCDLVATDADNELAKSEITSDWSKVEQNTIVEQ